MSHPNIKSVPKTVQKVHDELSMRYAYIHFDLNPVEIIGASIGGCEGNGEMYIRMFPFALILTILPVLITGEGIRL